MAPQMKRSYGIRTEKTQAGKEHPALPRELPQGLGTARRLLAPMPPSPEAFMPLLASADTAVRFLCL